MRPWSLLLVVLVALPLVAGVATLPPHYAPDAPIHTHVGARYLERGVAETGMKNLVTAVLLTLVSAPTIAHALARAGYRTGLAAWTRPGRDES